MHEGYCVGGTNHGKRYSHGGDLLRLPILEEISEVPDFSVTMEDMKQTISVEEYHWWTLIFKSGARVDFWKHESLTTKEELFALLIQMEME